jgi:hypothetical protein
MHRLFGKSRLKKTLRVLLTFCIQSFCDFSFAEQKVVFVVDHGSRALVAMIHRQLSLERVVANEEMEFFSVNNKFELGAGAAIQLKRIQPLVVIAPDLRVLETLGALRLRSKAVFVSHGPWASGGDEISLDKIPMMGVRVSTFLDADAACLDWLALVAPSIRHIGIIASTESSAHHMQKVVREYERDDRKVTGFFVKSIEEAVALVASSKAHKIDAWYFPHTPIVWRGPGKIIDAANLLKLPTAFEYSHVYSKVGGLVSCSSQFDLVQRVLDAVRYLLATGSESGPIDFKPTTMSVAINLDAVTRIGLTLPGALIRRFDHRFTTSGLASGEAVPLAEVNR